MMTQLSYAATMVAVGVFAAMAIMRDQIKAAIPSPSEMVRLAILRARGIEEYKGRHRARGWA
jgi:hypothetical protein